MWKSITSISSKTILCRPTSTSLLPVLWLAGHAYAFTKPSICFKNECYTSTQRAWCSGVVEQRETCSGQLWMNEWMCIYIPHTSHIVSRRCTVLIEWVERQFVKAPQAAAISSYIWSHSPTQPMHEMYNETTDRPPHRELRPLLFSTSVWVL